MSQTVHVSFCNWLSFKVAFNNIPQQILSTNPGDKFTGIIMIGDIGGILSENVPDKLHSGIITFFLKGAVYLLHSTSKICLCVFQRTHLDIQYITDSK